MKSHHKNSDQHGSIAPSADGLQPEAALADWADALFIVRQVAHSAAAGRKGRAADRLRPWHRKCKPCGARIGFEVEATVSQFVVAEGHAKVTGTRVARCIAALAMMV